MFNVRGISEKLPIISRGIPFIIAQYHPLAFKNLNFSDKASFIRSLLTFKVFITKLFPKEVSYKKDLDWFRINAPGSFDEVVGFTKGGSESYSFTLKVARINEFMGAMPELEFFKDFTRPQKIEINVPGLSIVGLGSDLDNLKNHFIEPPKALIIGFDGIFPGLYHIEKMDFKLSNFNTYNYPTIIEIKMDLLYIPDTIFDKAKVIYNKWVSFLFQTFISDIRNWTMNRQTYQGTALGLFLEFLDSFERSGVFSSAPLIGLFDGLIGDADIESVKLDDLSFFKLLFSTNDPLLANKVGKQFDKILKKGLQFKYSI